MYLLLLEDGVSSRRKSLKQLRILLIVIALLVIGSLAVIFGQSHGKPWLPVHYGLDIKGGVRAILRARTDQMQPGVPYNQATVTQILENRINSSGVGEATVQPKGTDQFIIEIPDVKNKNAVLEQLGTTASMTFYYFKQVQSDRDPNRPVTFTKKSDPKSKRELYVFTDRSTNRTFRDGAQIRADFTKLLAEANPPQTGATEYKVPITLYDDGSHQPMTLQLTADQQKRVNSLDQEMRDWHDFLSPEKSEVILTGNDIEPKSTAHLGGQFGTDPAVSQVFTADGTRKWAEFTKDHTKEIIGIVLDDAVLSAPFIKEPILDGQGEISGGFATVADAKALADMLNAGALPVPLEQVQVQSVEASLGDDAVKKSIFAGIAGLVLVLLAMLIWYRLPGLIADIALILYALFTFAIFRGGLTVLGVPAITLTLPGIAGFILSIGMAVDANILIFERMKEELRSGKSLRLSIEAGFKRAFTAIRDSNICTCITCIVLLSLGTPSVRGFALTLLIGVLVSLFSAITVTRTFLFLLVNSGVANNPALFGYKPSTTGSMDAETRASGWDIVGRRKFFYGLSLAIIVPGLVFWLGMNGLKKSIEFTGGSQIEVKYTAPVKQDAVEAALKAGGVTDALVQMAEGGAVAIVSTKEMATEKNPEANRDHQQLIHKKLTDSLNTVGANQEQSFGNVGGVISAELTSKAIQAVIIASLLIILYLAAVFAIGGFVAGLRLGASAIIALIHDVVLLIGMFAMFGYFLHWEIDSLFVTAMLTVIGFSVHDSVVIFDRVRENLHRQQRGETFEHLVNHSIVQTLGRSIRTSLTVVMTLIALIIFGGQTTRLLNVALFIGIVSGTYSSICNAAAILVDWENWLARRRAAGPKPTLAGAGAGIGRQVTSSNGSGNDLSSRPMAPGSAPTPSDAVPGPSASAIRKARKKPVRRD
jgi:SecD/SecF fusion protein